MSTAAPAPVAPASPVAAPPSRRRAARASRPGWVVLEDVPYDLYVRLRDLEANNHHRMLYYNGTLEIMSPGYRQEWNGEQVGYVVRTVCTVLGLPFRGGGSTTFRTGRPGRRRGAGAEADKGFYFANEQAVRGKSELTIGIDPPPDLWIEVNDSNRPGRRKRLVLAELRVPELWHLDAIRRTILFLKLRGDRYEPIERSESIPALTPALVLEALALADDLDEAAWGVALQDWARNLPRP